MVRWGASAQRPPSVAAGLAQRRKPTQPGGAQERPLHPAAYRVYRMLGDTPESQTHTSIFVVKWQHFKVSPSWVKRTHLGVDTVCCTLRGRETFLSGTEVTCPPLPLLLFRLPVFETSTLPKWAKVPQLTPPLPPPSPSALPSYWLKQKDSKDG